MNCDNKFCTYWDRDLCLLRHTSLNSMGICEECILVEFPDTQMEEARVALRNRLEQRWQKEKNSLH